VRARRRRVPLRLAVLGDYLPDDVARHGGTGRRGREDRAAGCPRDKIRGNADRGGTQTTGGRTAAAVAASSTPIPCDGKREREKSIFGDRVAARFNRTPTELGTRARRASTHHEEYP